MSVLRTPNSQAEELLVELPEHVDLVDLIEQPAWKTILIELVKNEKMNPWDIDVAELADNYMKKIQQLEKADLRIPANAILACSILLKMKARTIKLSSLDEMEEELEKARVIAEQQLLFSSETIPELYGNRVQKPSGVSLDALVRNIEEILEKTKQKSGRKLSSIEVPEFKIPFNGMNIEERTVEVMERVRQRADSQGLVTFSQLLDHKTPLEMISVFIPLLFLFNKEKISMWQEQFWQEIFISLNGDKMAIV